MKRKQCNIISVAWLIFILSCSSTLHTGFVHLLLLERSLCLKYFLKVIFFFSLEEGFIDFLKHLNNCSDFSTMCNSFAYRYEIVEQHCISDWMICGSDRTTLFNERHCTRDAQGFYTQYIPVRKNYLLQAVISKKEGSESKQQKVRGGGARAKEVHIYGNHPVPSLFA